VVGGGALGGKGGADPKTSFGPKKEKRASGGRKRERKNERHRRGEKLGKNAVRDEKNVRGGAS